MLPSSKALADMLKMYEERSGNDDESDKESNQNYYTCQILGDDILKDSL